MNIVILLQRDQLRFGIRHRRDTGVAPRHCVRLGSTSAGDMLAESGRSPLTASGTCVTVDLTTSSQRFTDASVGGLPDAASRRLQP
jgi:hypothetical protein